MNYVDPTGLQTCSQTGEKEWVCPPQEGQRDQDDDSEGSDADIHLEGPAARQAVRDIQNGGGGPIPGFDTSSGLPGPRSQSQLLSDQMAARSSELSAAQFNVGQPGMKVDTTAGQGVSVSVVTGATAAPLLAGPIAVHVLPRVANKRAIRTAACAAGFLAACGQGRLNELDKLGDDLRMLEQMRRLNQTRQQTTHSPK